MGQSTSTAVPPQFSSPLDLIPSGGSLEPRDHTEDIPDECLAYVFQFLGAGDRKRCSLVCRRWLRVDGETRRRLSLDARQEISSAIPSLFARFESVTKLALRCDRRKVSLDDDALVAISIRCRNLTRLKLRGCREVTDHGVAAFARNCSSLTKLSLASCAFGAEGLNAVLSHCTGLQELTVKRLRGLPDGGQPVLPGAASLKSICLKELVNGKCFEPLVAGSKNLKVLKLIRCLGDWDKVLETMDGSEFLTEVHLERIQVSDVALNAISKCVNLDILHIVKTADCSNLGLVSVAQNCRQLRKLHIDGWRTNRIGDEGLIAVAKQCPDLQELVLIGVHATHFSLSAIAANCMKLERLALCGSGTIGDGEIACIAEKCVALRKLCIKSCSITDIAIEALAWGCPKLVKVKVKKCKGVSNEAVDWLLVRKASLEVSFDATGVEALDASSSDVGGQESGAEVMEVGHQVALAHGPSTAAGRLAMLRAKLGVFASRNLVGCAFNRRLNSVKL
ncbi:hypothetical protein Tsubulata_060007 [Turnera subulata]|nr:hypothetical protein Tsubulata_060007 [Turnera subulata]